MNQLLLIIAGGAVFGVAANFLSYMGNPANTGVCVSCFLDNVAGAIGLHGVERFSYLRPEIPGFVLGSFGAAFFSGGFSSRGGSNPAIRFLSGLFILVGCDVFIGCPIKLLLRLSNGGVGALAGLAGMVAGIWLANRLIIDGFELDPGKNRPDPAGMIMPAAALALLGFIAFRPGFIREALSGPGAEHAPIAISLGAGLLAGAIAQKTRFCVTGSIRNHLLAGDRSLLFGTLAFFAAAMATAAVTGQLRPDFHTEAGAHTDLFWSFLAMFMVGLGAILADGCPFRHLILSAEGSISSNWTIAGMLAGAVVSVGLGVHSTSFGPSPAGKIAVLTGIIFFLGIGLVKRKGSAEEV